MVLCLDRLPRLSRLRGEIHIRNATSPQHTEYFNTATKGWDGNQYVTMRYLFCTV